MDTVSFKGGVASSHMREIAELIMPAIMQATEIEKNIAAVKTLLVKKFEKKYTETYMVDGGYDNTAFKAIVKAIYTLKTQVCNQTHKQNTTQINKNY